MKITPVQQWRKQKKIASLLGEKGEILEWTLIRVPGAKFMAQAPYPVVIVQMGNKKKMIGQLVDWEESDLHVGCIVEAVLRRAYTDDPDGIIAYTIKFKPLS